MVSRNNQGHAFPSTSSPPTFHVAYLEGSVSGLLSYPERCRGIQTADVASKHPQGLRGVPCRRHCRIPFERFAHHHSSVRRGFCVLSRTPPTGRKHWTSPTMKATTPALHGIPPHSLPPTATTKELQCWAQMQLTFSHMNVTWVTTRQQQHGTLASINRI